MTSYENLPLDDGVREILNVIAEIPKRAATKPFTISAIEIEW